MFLSREEAEKAVISFIREKLDEYQQLAKEDSDSDFVMDELTIQLVKLLNANQADAAMSFFGDNWREVYEISARTFRGDSNA